MIRFLDFLTPFINELFKVRQSEHNRHPKRAYKRVLVYALVAASLLANYFLIKKVYSLTMTAYTYKEKYKEMQNFPLLLGACEEKNSILVAIIDDAVDPIRPIKRPKDTQIDTLAMNHDKPEIKTAGPKSRKPKPTKPANDNAVVNMFPPQPSLEQFSEKSKKNLDDKSNVDTPEVKDTAKTASELVQEKTTIEQRRERMIEAQEKFRRSMAQADKARQNSMANIPAN